MEYFPVCVCVGLEGEGSVFGKKGREDGEMM